MSPSNPTPPAFLRARRVPSEGQELLHRTVPVLVELATAAQVLVIHRRVAADTGLSGVAASRDRLRAACEDVVRGVQAAHRALSPEPAAWGSRVNAVCDRLADGAAHDVDEALRALPEAVAETLAEALGTEGDPERARALATVAGTAMALWVVAGTDVVG